MGNDGSFSYFLFIFSWKSGSGSENPFFYWMWLFFHDTNRSPLFTTRDIILDSDHVWTWGKERNIIIWSRWCLLGLVLLSPQTRSYCFWSYLCPQDLSKTSSLSYWCRVSGEEEYEKNQKLVPLSRSKRHQSLLGKPMLHHCCTMIYDCLWLAWIYWGISFPIVNMFLLHVSTVYLIRLVNFDYDHAYATMIIFGCPTMWILIVEGLVCLSLLCL